MLKCVQCGKFFSTKKALMKHNAEAHNEKIPNIGRTRNIV